MKNAYEVRGEITAIYIRCSVGEYETIINTDKLEHVIEFPNTWYAVYSRKTNSFYVRGNMTVSRGVRINIGLHSWIMNCLEGMVVDHRNHDTLNNTNLNLRVLTNAENMQNRLGASSNSSSGIRGVYWHKAVGKWCAQLRVLDKKIDVGYFDNISEAESAVINARRIHMEFAGN